MALSVWAWLDLAPCAWQAFVWRLRGALARHAARLSLALRPDKTVAVVDDARRVLDGQPALSSPSSSPVVLALPRIEPHPQTLRDVAEYETTRLPVVSRSHSGGLISSASASLTTAASPVPTADSARTQSFSRSSSSGVLRRTREATSPDSASSLPSLGGVSAFARLLTRETEPTFPNYHAIILALCEALHSIECDDARMRPIVAEQLARAALELPRDVDAALFALLPAKPPLPPSGDAPDRDAYEDEDAPMPQWMVEWLMAPPSSPPSPSSSSSPESESESESEHDTNTDNRTGAA